VLFAGFELLDVFGPVELLSRFPQDISVVMVGPRAGAVRSSQGTEVIATVGYDDAPAPDIVMVPGGLGTRALAADKTFLEWLRRWASDADLVTSVCTGSALLAAAGLLDGYRATSNKRAFAWASGHGSDVEWVASARWVHDRDRWTSSGVAAGMDMTAALIGELFGPVQAQRAAQEIELELHTDATWDPFAAANDLV
jgi:transcriptional regulator GlxA family with amidase domain